MAVEHAAEDHEPQRPAGEHEHLVEAEHPAVLGVVEELGVGGRARRAGVQVDHHALFLADAPERLVVVVGVAGQPGGDRHGRQHHAAEDTVLPGPHDLLDGPVHIVEVDGHAAGPAARGGVAEVGQPAHVGVEGGPHDLETLVGGGSQIHGRRQPSGQDRPGQRHLGVNALLLEDSEAAPVAVAGHDPVGAVVGQPAGGGVGVDAHAGQSARRGGPHRVRLVHLAGVEAAEHGDGERRHVAEGGHRLTVGRVHVGEEVVEAVGRGVGVGRHHDVVAAAAVPALVPVPALLPALLPAPVLRGCFLTHGNRLPPALDPSDPDSGPGAGQRGERPELPGQCPADYRRPPPPHRGFRAGTRCR